MYIDKANTRLVAMKMKSLLLLLGAMFLAASPRAYTDESDWAKVANQVAFSLNLQKATTLKVTPLRGAESMAGVEALGFKDAGLKPQSGMEQAKDKTAMWYMVNIPVKVYASGRNTSKKMAPARYVRELQVTAYLLIKKPKRVFDREKESSPQSDVSKYYLLKKEITYADIPMNSGSVRKDGHELGEATFNVAVFIPRSTACMLADSYGSTADPISKLIVGYAAVATVNGEPCSDYTATKDKKPGQGETRYSKIFDKDAALQISSATWWKPSRRVKIDEPDVDICSIAETPYAIFYSGRYYPRVKPAFGSAPKETSSSRGSGESDTGDSSSSSSSGRRSSGEGGSSTSTSKSTGATTDYDSEL